MTVSNPYERDNSEVHRATVEGRPVYLKHYVPGGWLQTPEIICSQAAREVEIATRLASVPGLSERLGRIKVVEADPAQALVVTAEVPGAVLQETLRFGGNRSLRGTCVRALFVAGKWLNFFQTLPTDSQVVVSAPSDPENLLDYCHLRLKTLNELGYHWPNQRATRNVLEWLQRHIEATPETQLAKVWCHGDYGPSNMIWDGRVLTPIDFATCKLDLPLVDLTYLIHRLEIIPAQFPWRNWPVKLWRKACLRGYGMPDADRLPIYQALMVRHMLCRLQTLVRRPPVSRRQRWHNAWMRYWVRVKLSSLLRQS